MADRMQNASPNKKRILIVDDESGQRFLCNMALKRLGYETVAVENGREAIAKFTNAKDAGEDSPFALVLLDMVMEEDFDGLKTCDAIQDLYPEQKTIIVSGYAKGKKGDAAERLGADWLAKPYTIPELAAAVKKQLEPVE